MDDKIKVLILIDCQNDFIDGSLANKEAQEAIPNIIDKIISFNGDYIFLTMDSHTPDYLNTPEGKKLPVEHCIYGTEGWKINEEIRKTVEEKAKEGVEIKFIPKPTFASVLPFMHVPAYEHEILIEKVLEPEGLIERLIQLRRRDAQTTPMEIEMCGFCTDICVISNALAIKGFTYDFAEITVDSKCCAGVTPEKHEAALEVMRSCQINVI